MTEAKLPTRSAANDNAQSALSDLDDAVRNPPAWLTHALTVPREEGTVDAEGCAIHWFRWGDRTKPPLLLLHGFLSHARSFAFIAPYLADNYHIVAYDLSGMGDSEKRESYPEDVRVSELLTVCDHTGLFDHAQKPTIIAHSYGGQIGTSAIHAYPDRFAGIIICDLMILRPSFLEKNAELFKPPGNQNADRPNRIYVDYESAKKRFVLSPPQQVEVPALFDYIAYHSLKQVDGGWCWKFDPSVFRREPGFEKKWAETGQKVVTTPGRKAIIYGAESMLFNQDSANYVKELVQELDEAEFPVIAIPHARHHLMLDQPIALISVIRSLLSLWEIIQQE